MVKGIFRLGIYILTCTYFSSCINNTAESNEYIGTREEGVTDSLGQRQGEWITYDEKGKLIRKENFKDGLVDGEVLIYSNAVLYDKLCYNKGKKDGQHFHYNTDGSINFMQEYKDDMMTGHFIIYENGQVKQKGEMFNARNIGEWVEYTDDGFIEEISIFDTIKSTLRTIKMNKNGDTTVDQITNM